MSGTTPKAYRPLTAILITASYELFVLAMPSQQAVALDSVIVVLASGGAALACGWFATRVRGWERRWRILTAVGLGALAAGQSIWIIEPSEATSPSWADIPYLAGVPIAIAALVIFARHVSMPSAPAAHGRERLFQEARLVLDSLLVVGSLFLLAWMTTFRAILDQESTDQLSFLITFWYPFADLLLIAMVLLIYITRFIPRRSIRQLSFIGVGLTAIALSDLIFSYYFAGGIAGYPIMADIGYLAGPLLIARAAAIKDFEPARFSPHHAPQRRAWLAIFGPYLPLAMATVFLAGKVASGATLTAVEAASAVFIFIIVALRQIVEFVSERLNQAAKAQSSQTLFGDSVRHVLSMATTGQTSSPGIGKFVVSNSGRPANPGLYPNLAETRAPQRILPHLAQQSDTESDRQLRSSILSLRDEHRQQIERLQRSGNRITLWTFAGGVVLGTLGNVIVAIFMD